MTTPIECLFVKSNFNVNHMQGVLKSQCSKYRQKPSTQSIYRDSPPIQPLTVVFSFLINGLNGFWLIAHTVPLDYNVSMLTVAELSTFMRSAEKLLDAIERQDVINYLALHPKAGEVMQGTGGVRKLRWGRGGQGKSGGVRVIYYFHNESMPLYLLTLFSKNERSNLSQAERNKLSELTRMLVLAWQRKQNEHKV